MTIRLPPEPETDAELAAAPLLDAVVMEWFEDEPEVRTSLTASWSSSTCSPRCVEVAYHFAPKVRRRLKDALCA